MIIIMKCNSRRRVVVMILFHPYFILNRLLPVVIVLTTRITRRRQIRQRILLLKKPVVVAAVAHFEKILRWYYRCRRCPRTIQMEETPRRRPVPLRNRQQCFNGNSRNYFKLVSTDSRISNVHTVDSGIGTTNENGDDGKGGGDGTGCHTKDERRFFRHQ